MVLSNITHYLNLNFPSRLFVTTSYSFSFSRNDSSEMEVVHLDINTKLSLETIEELHPKVTNEMFIQALKEMEIIYEDRVTKPVIEVTTIGLSTTILYRDKPEGDIVKYITIVKTDLSYIITVIDPAL